MKAIKIQTAVIFSRYFMLLHAQRLFFQELKENNTSKMAYYLMVILKVSWLILLEDWFS